MIAKIKEKQLSEEEKKRIIDALKGIPLQYDIKCPFESFVNRGIKPCICNGTGKIKLIGGTGESPCPYCSPKIG